MSITLALTHYNRRDFLIESISKVIEDSRISEVVISDDCSTDSSFGDLLVHYKHFPKVHIFKNQHNVDCYANKRAAVLRATNDWVILFDSDNILPVSYLDALFALKCWDADVLYCPEFAEPHFDYTAFSGLTVDRTNVAMLLGKPKFECALNTANYFVNRRSYLDVWDGSVDPHTADSIYQAYNWLKSGRRIFFVPGLRYFHRIHNGSHYKLNVHKTGNFAQQVESKLRQLR